MPLANGRELFERRRQWLPKLKVVYMSGYDRNVIAHHGVLEDGVHFVQKPFTGPTLARKVEEVGEDLPFVSVGPRICDRREPLVTKRRPSGDDLGASNRPRTVSNARPVAPGRGSDAETVPPRSKLRRRRGADSEPASSPLPGAAESGPGSLMASVARMRDAFVARDHEAALAAAQRVLALDSASEEARVIAATCRETVEEVLVALLGGQSAVFDIVAKGVLLRALKSEKRTRVLIVLVEIGFNVGEILDICGEMRVEALRVLDELVRNGTIAMRRR